MEKTLLVQEPIVSDIAARPRISDVLFSSADHTFESIAVLQSNVRAIESAFRFSNGINPFVAIIGPSGWGKTHILQAASRHFRIDLGNPHVPVISAIDWLADARLRSFSGPLILDNAQDLIQRTRSRIQLQLTLERRVRSGKPTMMAFTESKLTRGIRSTLPNFRDWVVAVVKPPTVPEREKIVRKMAESEGLILSDTLIKLFASKLEGNGRTLIGALKRLRLTQQTIWLDPHATLKACGILNPFFATNSGWDLREHVGDIAKSLAPDERGKVVPFDLALHTMLRVADLGETNVAKFFRIEPAKAYSYAQRFASRVESDPDARAIADRFIDRVVDTL